MVRGEHRRIDVLGCHVGAQLSLALCVLLLGEGRLNFFAVADVEGSWHLHRQFPCHCERFGAPLLAGPVKLIATGINVRFLYGHDLELVESETLRGA
ncbi:hypothetical protein D3C80_918680 [compost metagenome]